MKNKKDLPRARQTQSIFFSSFITIISILIFGFSPTASLAAVTSSDLFDLVNAERQAQGLSLLAADAKLEQAAQRKGQAILTAQSFSHTIGQRKFSQWVKDENYDYRFIGENLAVHFKKNNEIVKAWMDSELHRKNILNPEFTESGMAVLRGRLEDSDTILIVQIFGTPALSNRLPAALTRELGNSNSSSNSSKIVSGLNKNNIGYIDSINIPVKVFTFFITVAKTTLTLPPTFILTIFALTLSVFSLFIIGHPVSTSRTCPNLSPVEMNEDNRENSPAPTTSFSAKHPDSTNCLD